MPSSLPRPETDSGVLFSPLRPQCSDLIELHHENSTGRCKLQGFQLGIYWVRPGLGSLVAVRLQGTIIYCFLGDTRTALEISGFYWSRRPDSNRRPADYESAALPTELRRPLGMRCGMKSTVVYTLFRLGLSRQSLSGTPSLPLCFQESCDILRPYGQRSGRRK